MTTESLQKELELARASLKEAEGKISKLTEELEHAKWDALQNKQTESALAHANNRLTQLMANLQSGIFVTDENRRIVFVNELFCKQCKINGPCESLVGTNGKKLKEQISRLFKDPKYFVERTEQIISEQKPVLNEEFELQNGKIYTRDYIPLFFNNVYRGHMWKLTDVTRNKTIEATFDAQRNFYEQILNNIPADIVVCDADLNYTYINPTAIADPVLRRWMIGKSNEDYCRRVNKPLSLAETRRKVYDKVKKSKAQVDWEEQFTQADGSTKYQLRKMYPVLDSDGAVDMVIGYGVDITERKKIEEQIVSSEKRLREIFSYSLAWIGTHDLEGKFLSINPAACKILGYTEDELIGKQFDMLIPEKHRAEFSDSYLKAIIKNGTAEGILNVLSKEGKHIYLLYQNFMVNEAGGEPYIIGFAQNITERVHAEEALKRSEQKYREIIDNMNLGMIEMDIDEQIIYANQRFCTMSGYEPDELIGKKATDLFLRGVSLKRTREQLSKRQYGITKSYELAVKTKSGEDKFWLTSAAPLFNSDESLKGTIGIHLDITGQKKLEEQLRDAKQETDRSSRSKDMFLTNMSHEIRTPLNAIMGLGKLLAKGELDVQQKNYLLGIESAATNLLNIINDLLDFSKIEAGKITLEHISFNMEVICEQVISILSHKADEKGLSLTHEIDPRIAPVLVGDPFRINQVFVNMVSNAIKFTEKGSVCLKAVLLEQQENSQKINVLIEDTGVGIKEEYLNKLFDKFTQEDETVVRKFGGTGLGMSITKQLMELMGGSISVSSKKNVGTIISLVFDFKIGTARVLEKKRTIKTDTSNINNKKILLVEDNNLNRLLAVTILTDYGAKVVEAENGAVAVDLMRKEEFDLVLMDIQMPVMDGIQATQIIRKEIDNAIPIIALTANAIKGKEGEFMKAGMDDFIVKPYNEINLVNPIAKWLNKNVTNPAPPPVFEEPALPEPAVTDTDAVNTDSLYDLTKLKNLARDDHAFIKKMLGLFIEETPPSVSQIKEAYKNGDLDTVRYLAHRTKPSIVNMAINSLKDDILAIEFMKEKSPEMDKLVEKLDSVITAVVRSIKDEYKL